jgi:hypothetical protein
MGYSLKHCCAMGIKVRHTTFYRYSANSHPWRDIAAQKSNHEPENGRSVQCY